MLSLDAISISDLTLDYVLDPTGQPHLHLLGGKGLYAAVGMWLWGLKVGLAASAGYDFDLSRLDPVRQAGIDISGVQIHSSARTVCWAQQYAPDGERIAWNPRHHFVGMEGLSVTPDSLPDIHGYSSSSVVRTHHVDLNRLPPVFAAAPAYHFAGAEFLRYPSLVAGWKRRGALLSLDADWYDGPPMALENAGGPLAPLAGFAALLPSVEDLFHLFGPTIDLYQAARTLGNVTQSLVVAKLGVVGSLLYQPPLGHFHHIPVVPVTAIDPTGAGDAYAGGFLAGLLKTGEPLEAALWATVSASFVVEGYGAAYALGRVTPSERDARLASLRVTMADG